MQINGAMLERSGWEKKGDWYILKGAIRCGWNEETCEMVVGYTRLPFPVEEVGELRDILNALRI